MNAKERRAVVEAALAVLLRESGRTSVSHLMAEMRADGVRAPRKAELMAALEDEGFSVVETKDARGFVTRTEVVL